MEEYILMFTFMAIFNTIFTIYASFHMVRLERRLNKLTYLFIEVFDEESSSDDEDTSDEEDESDIEEGEEGGEEGEDEEGGEEEEEEEVDEKKKFINQLFTGTFRSMQEGQSLQDVLEKSMKEIEEKSRENPELVSQSDEFALHSLAKSGLTQIRGIEALMEAVSEAEIFPKEQVSEMKRRFSSIRENLIEFGDTGDEQNLEQSVDDAELAMNHFLNDEFLGKAREKLKQWTRNPAEPLSSSSSSE